MDLIDRYVFEVARHLQYRNGRDVATELHSLLSDSLEQRAELAGHPPNEEMAVDLLREFGERKTWPPVTMSRATSSDRVSIPRSYTSR
jgi:hypothetical protein